MERQEGCGLEGHVHWHTEGAWPVHAVFSLLASSLEAQRHTMTSSTIPTHSTCAVLTWEAEWGLVA